MQNQLFQLILMGQFSFLICEVHQYIFIDRNKTWCEARAYCEDKHTALASVPNVRFMKKLQNTLSERGHRDEAWIGLYWRPNQTGTWKWSQPVVESNLSWANNEPDNMDPGIENCVRLDNHIEYEGWKDVTCGNPHKFICYNEDGEGENEFYVSNEMENWSAAQNFCRSHHTDLASGSTQLNKLKNESFHHWIGYFRDSWRWTDNSSSSYRDWETDSPNNPDKDSPEICAVTLPGQSRKWKATKCDKKKPFICYQDNVKLIKEEMEWGDAFEYCRQEHSDLVSIVTLEDQSWIQEKAKEANTDFIWLGLQYSCPLDLWFWLNDMVSDEGLVEGKRCCDTVVAMSKYGKYTMISKSEKRRYNFVCAV